MTTGRLDHISADPRHVGFRLLVERPIALREYGDWSMGYLHNLGLEDELERPLLHSAISPDRIVSVINRMKRDTIMGALSTSY